MKIGSIVHCINNGAYANKVKLKTDYTVSGIVVKGTVVLKRPLEPVLV